MNESTSPKLEAFLDTATPILTVPMYTVFGHGNPPLLIGIATWDRLESPLLIYRNKAVLTKTEATKRPS